MNRTVLFVLLVLLCCLFNNNVVFCKYPYLYSFASDNTFQLINIETNQLILNQTLQSTTQYTINKIIEESNDGDGLVLFVQDQRDCMLLEYNYKNNQFSPIQNKTGIIKLGKLEYEYVNQQFLYIDNNIYISAHVDGIKHNNIASIVNWDFNKDKINIISLNDSLYNEHILPFSTIDYNNRIYIYLYYHDVNQLPFIQTFKIGSNGNPNSDFKMYSLKNNSLTCSDTVDAIYYSSYGNTIIVSTSIEGLSVCQLDLTQGECSLKYSVSVGSYDNNFVNYFLSADNSKLVHMDGEVDNSDYIEFTIIDLSSFSIVNTFKLTNYYKYTGEAFNFYL